MAGTERHIGKMDTKGYWMVNSASIYVPSEVQVTHTNVVSKDSGRTEDGINHITWIRRDVRKVSLKYYALTGNEVKYMRDLMQGKEYTFHYFDAGREHFSAYTGDNDYQIYAYHPTLWEDEGGLYRDFQIDAVEM